MSASKPDISSDFTVFKTTSSRIFVSACVEDATFIRPMPQHVKPPLNPIHYEVCSRSSVVEVMTVNSRGNETAGRKKETWIPRMTRVLQLLHCCHYLTLYEMFHTTLATLQVRSCQCHCQCLTDFLFTELNWRTQPPDNKSQRTDQREWNAPPATRKFVWTSPGEATTLKKEQRFSV